jgi:hypothetical protein
MQTTGSGGLGAVSVGIPEALVILVLLLAVFFGLWKLVKVLWAAFSG